MWIVLLSFWLVATACTFRGAIPDQFYQPAPRQQEKIPFNVALVVDPTKRMGHIVSTNDPLIQYDVDLYPALPNAVRAELATIFKEVKIVRESREFDNADLVAILNFKAESKPGEIFDCRIELTFQDPRSKQDIATYTHDQSIKVGWSGGALFVGGALTGATLFLGSPITLPAGASMQGNHAIEVLQQNIPEMIRQVSAYPRDDQRIAAFSRGGAIGAKSSPVAALPGQAPRLLSDVDTLPATKALVNKSHHAIVIGIEQYRQKLPKADFAAHDAEIVGQYLTKAMGYAEENVVVLLNDHAARTDLEKYIEKWLPNRVEKGDSVFVYFSGHGAPNSKTGDAYLVPYDGDPGYLDTTGYSLKRLYDSLAKLPAREVVVLLDSCFSGAGGRSVIAKGMRPIGLSMENQVLAGSIAVVTASSGDQVSSTYDAKGHGLLTYYVLKGLQGDADQNQDGTIVLTELFDYVRPQVERIARREYNNEQVPQLIRSAAILRQEVLLRNREER